MKELKIILPNFISWDKTKGLLSELRQNMKIQPLRIALIVGTKTVMYCEGDCSQEELDAYVQNFFFDEGPIVMNVELILPEPVQYNYDEYIEEFVKCLKEKFRNVEFKNKNVNIFESPAKSRNSQITASGDRRTANDFKWLQPVTTLAVAVRLSPHGKIYFLQATLI